MGSNAVLTAYANPYCNGTAASGPLTTASGACGALPLGSASNSYNITCPSVSASVYLGLGISQCAGQPFGSITEGSCQQFAISILGYDLTGSLIASCK